MSQRLPVSRDEEKTEEFGELFQLCVLTWWELYDSTHLPKLTELYTKNGIPKHV